MDALGPWHLLIIAAFFVMLFGARRLPDAARALGRSARIMKSELKGLHEEPSTSDTESPAVEAHLLPATTQPVAADDIPVAARDNGRR
jgi:sec-independent protein translocase protein TatA